MSDCEDVKGNKCKRIALMLNVEDIVITIGFGHAASTSIEDKC
jgi:hypothetical protein